MYQTIGEDISVIGVYRPRGKFKFEPRKFLWRGSEYHVSEITLCNDVKDGGVRKRYFSLVAKGNVYRISFNRDTEHWTIEEVWCE